MSDNIFDKWFSPRGGENPEEKEPEESKESYNPDDIYYIKPSDERFVTEEFIIEKLKSFQKDLDENHSGFQLTGRYAVLAVVLADYEDENGIVVGNFLGMATETRNYPKIIKLIFEKMKDEINKIWAKAGMLLHLWEQNNKDSEDENDTEIVK